MYCLSRLRCCLVDFVVGVFIVAVGLINLRSIVVWLGFEVYGWGCDYVDWFGEDVKSWFILYFGWILGDVESVVLVVGWDVYVFVVWLCLGLVFGLYIFSLFGRLLRLFVVLF